jgi:hypothetical protein
MSRSFKDDSEVPPPREILLPGFSVQKQQTEAKLVSSKDAEGPPNALAANLDVLLQQANMELDSALADLNAEDNTDEVFTKVTFKLLKEANTIISNNPTCEFLLVHIMDQARAHQIALRKFATAENNFSTAFTETKTRVDKRM